VAAACAWRWDSAPRLPIAPRATAAAATLEKKAREVGMDIVETPAGCPSTGASRAASIRERLRRRMAFPKSIESLTGESYRRNYEIFVKETWYREEIA